MKLGPLWRAVLSVASRVSIRVKIMGIVLGLTLLLGGGVTLQVRATQESTLSDELAKRGLSIARDVASRGTDSVLTNNSFALHQLVRDTLEDNEDIRYAFVLDQEGHVLAHTFGRGLPRGLAEVNLVPPGVRYRMEILQTEEGLVRDLAVPILEGRAGTARVGMSDVRLRSLIAVTTERLLLATGLASAFGLCLAYLLTVFLTRPISELVEVAEAVTAGNLGRQAKIWAEDEIGHLGRAFNAMTSHLAHSSQEILRRNRELAALNAVAAAIARPFSREGVLSASLDKVLEVMDLQAGIILLHDSTTQTLVATAAAGLASKSENVEPCPKRAGCICWDAFDSGQVRVVEDVSQSCPHVGRSSNALRDFETGVCVPLVSKGSCLGVLHVVGTGHRSFGEEQLSLLRSIGDQIGVAVENARLWEELRQREALRTHLLERVITAQEEERRRVARELHDDMAQGLAVLMMNLEVAEGAIPSDLAEVRGQLARTRELTARSLAEVRRLILDLRPIALDNLGLAAAVRWYAEHRLGSLDIDTEVEANGLSARLPSSVETTVFRIVQEAINNVAKHSRARSMRIEIKHANGFVTIEAVDDGIGFAVSQLLATEPPEFGGLGLLGVRERAILLGGTMEVDSVPGEGTRLRICIPIPKGGDTLEKDTHTAGR